MKFEHSLRRRWLVVACLSMLPAGGLAWAQDSTTETSDDPGQAAEAPADSKARIEFEETTFDFGDITDRAPVSHIFKFRNVGTEVLHITKVNWGCNCTSARALQDEVEPGDEGAVEVTFDPRSRNGPYHKNANVWTNDPTNSMVRLWYNADIDPICSVWPTPVRITNVAFRHEGAGEFFLTSDRPEFKVTRVEGKSRLLSGRVLRAEIVEKQPEWHAQKDGRPIHQVFIEVSVDKEAPIGPVAGELLVTMHVVNETGEEFEHQIEVPVQATVLGPIEINPGRVNFGKRRAGDDIQRTIRINSRTELDDFKILSIEHVAKDGVKPEVEWGEVVLGDINRAYDLHLRITAPETARLYRGMLIVNTDNPFEPEVKIPWTLYVR